MPNNVMSVSGNFDAMIGNVAHGWVWDSEIPEQIQEVEVFVDSVLVGTWIAAEFREDLRDAGIGSGFHHFKIDLSAFLTKDEHEVDIWPKRADRALPGSPQQYRAIGAPALSASRRATGKNDHTGTNALEPRQQQNALSSIVGEKYVNVYTVTFFDFEGRKVYPGGAERYIFDLANLLAQAGQRLRVYQAGNAHWKRQVDNIEVIALPWGGDIYELSKRFAAETPAGILNIYSPFTLAAANLHRPSIGICHGVYWDYGASHLYNEGVARDVFSAILHLDQVVSVDANSINVVRAARPDLASRMKYVPNYVGNEFFIKRPTGERGKLNVIYPRRLYGARGYWLAAEAFRKLLPEMQTLQVAFVGDADPKEREDVNGLKASFPKAVSWEAALPHAMPGHYAKSDVAIIPTLHSEGTSLSALEALAAGNVVIASDVGGLSNIIIDELNGLLISPSAKELEQAIRRVATDAKLRSRMVRNGIETAWAFRKEKWEQAWRSLLESTSGSKLGNASETHASSSRPVIVHPRTDGVVWGIEPGAFGLPKQRPQHIMQALGQLGFNVTCISDEVQMSPQRNLPGSVEVLGRGAQVYAQNSIIYVYYAYHVWALGAFGRDWLKSLGEADRVSFDATSETHDLPNAQVWFDLIDDPSLHDSPIYWQAVNLFIQHADYVTTSSRLLFNKYKDRRPDIMLLENACWSNDFLPGYIRCDDVENRCDVAESVAAAGDYGGRIIGYVGAISDWFNFELIDRLCNQFPADQIVLIGPVSHSVQQKISQLQMHANFTVIGPVPYEDLPSIVRSFDVGILPFTPNSVTHATNPLKLYEYLSAGCPVVSTKLTEIELITSANHLAFIRSEEDGSGFLQAVNYFLCLPTSARLELGVAARKFAMSNTWSHRAALVAKLFLAVLVDQHQHSSWRHNESAPPLVSSHNPLSSDREVLIRWAPAPSGVSISLAGETLVEGDTATCSFTFFAPTDGFYRVDVTIDKKRVNRHMRGYIQHVLKCNGSEVVINDVEDDYDSARAIVVAKCSAGLNTLSASVVVVRSCSERGRNHITELKIRDISFRSVRATTEQTIVRRNGSRKRSSGEQRQVLEGGLVTI